MRSAFITGASGPIGRRLCERLATEGAEVTGVDLQTDKGRGVVAGDIGEEGLWQRAAGGAEVVLHTAAIESGSASREAAWRINVLGTRHALDAAVGAGAKRFVHLSSVRVFGDRGFPDGVTEDHPVRPDGSVYVDSRIAAEQVVLQAHAAGVIECAVIRSADLYGPGARRWTVLPVGAIKARRLILPAMGRGVFSPVFVDNLIEGAVLAATRQGAAGEVFTISDGVGVACRDFFGHYSRMLGRRRPPALPTPLALALAGLPEAFAWIAGTGAEATLATLATMRYLARTGTYSIEKARRRLSYEPLVDLAEGMRRTERWLRDQRLVDHG